MRAKLRGIGIQSSRVLDICYPDDQVIGLLIHNDYVQEVEDILTAKKFTLLDFDPCSPKIVRDPIFADKDDVTRSAKAIEIHQNRLMSAVKRVTPVTRQIALARSFLASQWIADSQLEELMQLIRPKTLTRPTDITMAEAASSDASPPSDSRDSQAADGTAAHPQ